MRRTNLGGANCPIARALSVVGDWWSLLIVRNAFGGQRRFGEFQKHLGVAKNILASRLRALVEAGIFELAPVGDSDAYQEYVLTDKGRALKPVLDSLRAWGSVYCPGSMMALAVPGAGPDARATRSASPRGTHHKLRARPETRK